MIADRGLFNPFSSDKSLFQKGCCDKVILSKPIVLERSLGKGSIIVFANFIDLFLKKRRAKCRKIGKKILEHEIGCFYGTSY